MNVLKKIMVLIILLLGICTIIYWKTINQAYHWLNYSNYQSRSYYFQNQEKVFPHRTLIKSKKPFQFPRAKKPYKLPNTFTYEDSIINTSSFLKEMGYEGLLIIHKGVNIYEKYWNDMNKSTTHSSMSMSKAITSILIGFAIDDGLIKSEKDLLIKYLPEYKNSEINSLTIEHCLDMLSGIDFCDFCEEKEAQSSLTDFFWHITLKKPLSKFITPLKLKNKPGSVWEYQTINVVLLGLVLDRVLQEQTISEYAQIKLWEPLGMEYDAQWIMGGDELELVGSNFTASLRDYAKLGQFYLQKGRWDDKKLLSENWVLKSTIPDKPLLMSGPNGSDELGGWGYKHLWWIPDNKKGYEFMAAGRFGQIIYVNAETEVVIVGLRISHNPDTYQGTERYNLNSKVDLFQQIARSLN